jgi:hypothetical protein
MPLASETIVMGTSIIWPLSESKKRIPFYVAIFHSFNAAYQPNRMFTFGILRLAGGISLFVRGFMISSTEKKKERSVASKRQNR